jgi:hypothetical protein
MTTSTSSRIAVAEDSRRRTISPGTNGWCAAKSAPKRRARKPNVRAMIREAERDGKKVSGATVAADGSVTLQFGEQTNTEPNPWERAMQGPKQ